jgi:polysaccharide deacetylase family protein (PEP-CTERM system associated)
VTNPHSFITKASPLKAGQAAINAMTVDVEDYFQVQALEDHFERSTWDQCASRVETNTKRILDLFAAHGTKATFFTLGWVAERYPGLIKDIVKQGHELASHGLEHARADGQTPDQFREDIRRSKQILEDTGGAEVIGYRAATFSIGATNLWAYDILEEEGFSYSSSINPVKHDNYGTLDAPRFAFLPASNNKIIEYPITTLEVMGQNMPCGGGGYFRILPYAYFRHAIQTVNTKEGWPFMFYFHPWEIDPEQPRPEGVKALSRFRHYTNLHRMESRLERLLSEFQWGRVDETFHTRPTEKALRSAS